MDAAVGQAPSWVTPAEIIAERVATLERFPELAGSAVGEDARRRNVAWMPGDTCYDDLGESPACWWTVVEAPSSILIPPEDCDAAIGQALAIEEGWSHTPDQGSALDVGSAPGFAPFVDHGIKLLQALNALWWRLELRGFRVMVMRYREGDSLVTHTDLNPGRGSVKAALSIQLADPETYAGGNFVMYRDGVPTVAPRTRGTAIGLPCWASHGVTEVRSGERWSLVVWGMGPPLR